MGFLETLIPEAPALIEKNKTKRYCIDVSDCESDCLLCARTPTFGVEPFLCIRKELCMGPLFFQ